VHRSSSLLPSLPPSLLTYIQQNLFQDQSRRPRSFPPLPPALPLLPHHPSQADEEGRAGGREGGRGGEEEQRGEFFEGLACEGGREGGREGLMEVRK
jgi:hypothetical protein